MTIEILEQRLDKIKNQHARVMKIVKAEGITTLYNPKVMAIIERNEPQMGPRCEDIIRSAGAYTAKHGFCERTDYIKNFAYGALGKAIGVNLEDW